MEFTLWRQQILPKWKRGTKRNIHRQTNTRNIQGINPKSKQDNKTTRIKNIPQIR